MPTFLLNNRAIDPDQEHYQAALERAYASKVRPMCACKAPPVPMYISKIGGVFHVKRMPGSGSDHHMACDSYDPPAELSGLGEVLGTAIREDTETGLTNLRLDFALSKGSGRPAPTPSDVEHDSAKADSTKLTIRALLHYLWDNSKLTHWMPNWQGKRSWAAVYNQLAHSVQGKQAKGGHLADSLFIPPPFFIEKKDELQMARSAFMTRLQVSHSGARKLGMLIGELKVIEPSRFGFRLVIKHMPDYSFTLTEDILKRINKRFENELALWSHFENTHLVVIATFAVNTAGLAMVEEIALMLTTENWIPFSDMNEKTLIDRLTFEQRRFIKGLRYNMKKNRPLACAQLVDTAPVSTAMFVTDDGESDEYNLAFDELREKSELDCWVWNIAEPMPTLPAKSAAPIPR